MPHLAFGPSEHAWTLAPHWPRLACGLRVGERRDRGAAEYEPGRRRDRPARLPAVAAHFDMALRYRLDASDAPPMPPAHLDFSSRDLASLGALSVLQPEPGLRRRHSGQRRRGASVC